MDCKHDWLDREFEKDLAQMRLRDAAPRMLALLKEMMNFKNWHPVKPTRWLKEVGALIAEIEEPK